jgi:alkylation response protein AidB-like acyl-CoA dehydrogenase
VSGNVEPDRWLPISPAAWDDAIALGQLALSHELIGAARTMLELARQHATERVQFGRPIAMFQAVRHRLADGLIAIEAADSLLAGAWEQPSPVLAAMAKGMAGRGARTAAKHCQQVLAGIGFTAEHPFHRFYKRVVVLDQLLGAGAVLTRQLGTDALATGTLPPAFTL